MSYLEPEKPRWMALLPVALIALAAYALKIAILGFAIVCCIRAAKADGAEPVNSALGNSAQHSPGGQYWRWSQPAAHHRAAVFVQNGQHCGSGTLIGKGQHVVTAGHVVDEGPQVRIRFADGTVAPGQVIAASRQPDVAWIAVTPPPGIPAIPLAPVEQWPQTGDELEYVGYGGPSNQLRHFTGRVKEIEADGTIHGDAYLLNGDSGGAVLWRGMLVGVISGGRTCQPQQAFEDGHAWPLHYPALSPRVAIDAHGRGIAPTFQTSNCPWGACPPRSPGWNGNQGRGQSCPPPNQQPPNLSPGPGSGSIPPPGQLDAVLSRLDALQAELAAIRAKSPQPGPPGECGPQGPAGPQGPPGTLAHFSPIEAQLLDGNGAIDERQLVGPGGVLQLRPIRVQIVDAAGNVHSEGYVNHGGTLRMQLSPVAPQGISQPRGASQSTNPPSVYGTRQR